MLKRGHQVKSWKERYMVLNPTEMKYYVSSHQKHLKGTIVFDKTHSVEVMYCKVISCLPLLKSKLSLD